MTEETAPAGGSGPETGHSNEGTLPRGKWANKREFMLAMAGLVVGLGSFVRFPYLCFKNGGVVFFIPHFVCLFFCGFPVFFLETALGQYTSESAVTAWRKICPMFQGVGIASQVMLAYVNMYHIVLYAWVICYVYYSFQSPLPWTTCDNSWNTPSCHVQSHLVNWSAPPIFDSPDYDFSYEGEINHRSPEEEFFQNKVLRLSSDFIANLGTVHLDLAVCLLLAWILCYFCIFLGIKSAGKVVYVTSTLPYLMLFILFIRGVTLPGAGEGLRYYLYPDFYMLAQPSAWRDAVFDVLFSIYSCLGVLTALGSYNKYNNNCYRDCLLLCCLSTGTSIFAGLAVFSTLGFMAAEMGVDLAEVASSGIALIFHAYPRALSMVPGSNFWCLFFFLMILVLGLDSQFLSVESLVTAIADLFPRHLRKPRARMVLVLVTCVVFFLLGLPFISGGGSLLFHLMDSIGVSGQGILFIVCFETTIIGWVYGADRFYDNIEDMIGYKPFPVLKYCWLFITPLICWIVLSYNLTMTYTLTVYGYQYSIWSHILGAVLLMIPLMCIPVFLFIRLCKNPENMTTPSSDLRQAQPHKPILTLCRRVIFKSQAKPNRHVDENDEKMMMGEPSTA
ncbi:sodium- and chloride-dependent GABA transporter 2-like isoform X2 [Plectropomus leopardus]|nr:sodium- and chloride-dependent GABA transporter 2-like isoform X2 [Plectropomus leopardus]XP_042367346.1 sodium- and chloride-dependent GABA transporter 2-like isoform X2 [Plectropomus leopardus]